MRVLPKGWRERFRTAPLPPDLDHLPAIAPDGVDEVIHCAGSLSYTDVEVLEAVNVRLTSRLVEAAATWGVDRFVHISTAFAGGYPEPGATIPEQLHDEGCRDPTPYTASKRRGEHISDVTQEGLPRAQRALLRLGQVNLDIAGHDWRFDTSTIDRLVVEGAPFVDASLKTVHRGQEAYFGQSARLARFRAEVVRG